MKKLIEKALKKGRSIEVNSEKIAVLSDLHLGAGYANDNSLKNNLFLFNALSYYFENGYTVLLNGDTFEIAENPKIEYIKNVHEDIMWILGELYNDNRLVIVKGNHDAFLKNSDLYSRTSSYTKTIVNFLQGVRLYDYANINVNNKKFCVMHGHQSNIAYTVFNRIIVHLIGIWGFLERWALKDPTGAYGSFRDWSKEIKQFSDVAKKHGFTFICGHTHSVELGKENYYNIGSGVMSRCITCCEIINGIFIPYKWSYNTNNGQVFVEKKMLVKNT